MEKQTALLMQWNKKEHTTDLCNNKDEYQKFLGVAGDELDRLLQENQDVLCRLKERG